MSEKEIRLLQYDEETGTWVAVPEPYAILVIATEEDLKTLQEMIAFWKEQHKEDE